MSAFALNSQEDLTNFTKKTTKKQQETIKFFHVEQHNTIAKLANRIYFPEWIFSGLTAVWISLSVSLHMFIQ